MKQRKTYKAALQHARACMLQAESANTAGLGDSCHAWLECGLRFTTERDVLPIDMAQLRRLAINFSKDEERAISIDPITGVCIDNMITIDEFLKFCKDNAK